MELTKHEDEEKYTKKERNEGDGPLRIGKHLQLTYGLYSMVFVTAFHHDFIYDLQKRTDAYAKFK